MAEPNAQSGSSEPARSARLEDLEPALAELARPGELDEVASRALGAVARVVAIDAAAVLIVDRGDLRLAAGWGLDDADQPGSRLPIADGLPGLVASTLAPRLALSAANDPQVRLEGFRRHGVRSVYGVPLLASGDLVGVALLGSTHAYDFPERDKRLFEGFCRQLGPIAGYLGERRRGSEEAARRQALFGIVAHDVRTPLSSIKIGAGTLAREPHPSESSMVRRTAEIIERSAVRVERAVDDLFSVLMLREQPGFLARATHDLRAIVEQAAGELRAVAGERGVGFAVEPIDSPPPVDVDPDRVRDAVAVLLSTALDDSPPGGAVTVTIQARGPEVLLAVEDTGRGHSAEELPALFEPATRTSGGARRTRPLGLALARAVVEAHGGRMWAASAVGRGTTIFATLPLAPR